jgi:hypothetical protein
MRAFSLGCGCCDGKDPLIFGHEGGGKSIVIFPTRELAQIEATEYASEGGEPMKVIEIEIKTIES